MLLHHGEHGRHAEPDRHARIVEQVVNLINLKRLTHNRSAADVNERRGEDVESAGVKERRVKNRNVVRRESPTHHRVHRIKCDVAISELCAFGQARCAAGVTDHPHVVESEINGLGNGVGIPIAFGEREITVEVFI